MSSILTGRPSCWRALVGACNATRPPHTPSGCADLRLAPAARALGRCANCGLPQRHEACHRLAHEELAHRGFGGNLSTARAAVEAAEYERVLSCVDTSGLHTVHVRTTRTRLLRAVRRRRKAACLRGPTHCIVRGTRASLGCAARAAYCGNPGALRPPSGGTLPVGACCRVKVLHGQRPSSPPVLPQRAPGGLWASLVLPE